jgi:hypothetical protein
LSYKIVILKLYFHIDWALKIVALFQSLLEKKIE